MLIGRGAFFLIATFFLRCASETTQSAVGSKVGSFEGKILAISFASTPVGLWNFERILRALSPEDTFPYTVKKRVF